MKSYCESKYENADSDGNGVDYKSMKTITKIDRNDNDSRTTTLMIVIVMAISWETWK